MNNIRKIFCTIIALTMVIGAFAILIPAYTAEPSEIPRIADPVKMDVDATIKGQSPSMSNVLAASSGMESKVFNDFYAVNSTEEFYDSYYGTFIEMEKRAEGEYCEVWVGTNLSFPMGDPRNDAPWNWTIDQAHVDYMIDEFDNNIYSIEAEYFGTPDPLDGTNSLFEDWEEPYFETNDSGKVMIMIYNIIDDNYFDPDYPNYVAGFYSPTTEAYYDRNIIHIDCWAWDNRTGENSSRPFLYEGVVAHEYQHLLHDDIDSDEDTWLNEGCSMYAEFLCGYAGNIWDNFDIFFQTPDNSLTEWGDQGDITILSDYGHVYLFMIYLNDHFDGANFIAEIQNSELNGVESVEAALANAGCEYSFDEIYRMFTLANFLHTDDIGDGWYNYETLDFESPEAYELKVLDYDHFGYFDSASYYFGTTTYEVVDSEGITHVYDSDTATLGAYSADYIHVDMSGMDGAQMGFWFDGDDETDTGWHITSKYHPMPLIHIEDNAWYAGDSDLRDVSLVGTYDLTGVENATLTFDTYVDIEEFWDFGFVQVSTDGGETWTSLENEYTTNETDPDAHPAIVAELPGLTGYSWDWMTMSFDLSNYTGQEIMFQFRYMTDWGYTDYGWQIDNVYINDVLIDNADDVIGLVAEYPDVDFSITIYAPGGYQYWGGPMPTVLTTMDVEHFQEFAARTMVSLTLYTDVYFIITPNEGPVDYYFGLGWIGGPI